MSWEQTDLNRIEIPMDEIYSSMGFKDSVPDSRTEHTVDFLLEEAAQFLRPQFKYILLDGALSHDRLHLTLNGPDGPVTFNIGRIIGRQLNGAVRFAVFVATAGPGYAQWLNAVNLRSDMSQTYAMDVVGSQIVESVADYMEQVLQTELDECAFHRTNRFSPGYCGWQVSEQPGLFSLFDEPNPCGVSLNEACLMLPEKSVSGVIGVGPDVRYLPYTCGLCDMKQCYKRKSRT